jgi:hypothetical protein
MANKKKNKQKQTTNKVPRGQSQPVEATEPLVEDGTGPVYFWKETSKDGFLCQWYEFPIEDDAGVRYPTCEQYVSFPTLL